MLGDQNIKAFLKKFIPNCPNWTGNVFMIKKFKSTEPWIYFISDLNGEEIVGSFYKKELLKTNQAEFRVEKLI